MKFNPILFSTSMIQAILDNRKNQTRRTRGLEKFNIVPDSFINNNAYINICRFWDSDKENDPNPLKTYYVLNSLDGHKNQVECPYGKPGDILWVRETFYAYGFWILVDGEWHFDDCTNQFQEQYLFENCKPKLIEKGRCNGSLGWYKRPSIHMPKSACRIFLKVKSVRVERLQDIREEDAIAEGVLQKKSANRGYVYMNYLRRNYEDIGSVESFETLWQSIKGEQSWKDNSWVWVIEFELYTPTSQELDIFYKQK